MIRSFFISVLLPLAAILMTVLIIGCEPVLKTHSVPKLIGPIAPMPYTCLKVVAFDADWCPACRVGLPKLEELKRQGVEVDHWNIDRYPEMGQAYGITSLPVYFVSRGSNYPVVRTQSIDEVVRLVNER